MGAYLVGERGEGPKAARTGIAEGADGLPVVLVHREPLFAVSWANVDVDRAEVVAPLDGLQGRQRTARSVGAEPALRDDPALGRSLADRGAPAAALLGAHGAFGCQAPSCTAAPCSCPGWCGPRAQHIPMEVTRM